MISERPVIEVKGLTKYYPPMRIGIIGFQDITNLVRGRRQNVLALEDVTFDVHAGEVFGLLGPNGAGKTTFCKIISDLVLPNRGRAYILGHDVNKEHRKIAGKLVCIFGGETTMWGVFAWRMSLYRNLRFIASLWKVPRKLIPGKIDRALTTLGLQ